MATEITATTLNGVHNQEQAIEAIRDLLKNAVPGEVSFSDDATKEIEQYCPALARSIRNAVNDWNNGLESPFLSQAVIA